MAQMAEQKAAFAERLKRINSGQQFEHADVVGFGTQKRYEKRYGDKAKRPKRSPVDRFMVLIAFLAGMTAMLLGRLAYFQMSRIEGLPPAFYDLGARGMILFALVLAAMMVVIFHLATRVRLQALLVGVVVMHYGEVAVAANAPELWSQMFSPEYAAEISARGAEYRLTTAG